MIKIIIKINLLVRYSPGDINKNGMVIELIIGGIEISKKGSLQPYGGPIKPAIN